MTSLHTCWSGLSTGWSVTLRKWSVQLTAVQMIALTAVGIAFTMWPYVWIAMLGLFVCLVLAIAALIAANLPQRLIETIDKRTHIAVPKDPGDGPNN